MPFTSCGGCLKDIFITEAEIIDRYVGNQLWTWGCGGSGALGANTVTNQSSPVQTISGGTNWKQINGKSSHMAGIKTDGTLWLWGSGTNGRLGNNSIISRSSPVQTISGGTNWKQAWAAGAQTVAIKTDGSLWLWGCNDNGQLGTNNLINRSSPVQTISGGTNWKQVSAANFFSAAIKTDGTLWLWGAGGGGGLGTNSLINTSSPVQTISGGTNWKEVSLGDVFSAAIKNDGTLWMWGPNSWGQLGANTVTNQSSPIQTVSGGTNWKQISASSMGMAAIKTDGSLWLWGCNCSGMLGDNSIIMRSSPVQTVSGGTNWKQVSSSRQVVAAIKTDGSLWLWGAGTFGALGHNSIADRSSPIQTISGGTNWKQVIVSSAGQAAAITYTES